MKKLFVVISVLLIIATSANVIRADQWAKTYGGSDEEWTYLIQETLDGGYALAGLSRSFTTNRGFEAWVLKLESTGAISWEKTYGGSKYDLASYIQQTSDEGYIVAGYTESFGAGGADAWVIKLDSTGGVTWEKAYGDTASDEATYIQQTSEGGYIVAGRTKSFGGGDSDAWVLKLDSTGGISWQRRYGGNDYDRATCIQQTPDEGYIVAGDTWSVISGMTGHSDIFLMKLASNGDVSWQKTYGDIDDDSLSDIQQTTDGGYILAGDSRSFGGISNIWILKVNSVGAITWQKTYGGVWSHASSIQETSDGGYIVAGYTFDYGAGWSDVWVIKLDSSGGISWQKTYGGSDFDWAYSIEEISDGYIVAGDTVSYGAGEDDSLVLKFDDSGNIPDCSIIGTSLAEASDSTIYAEDAYLSIMITTATPIDTSASIQDTSAETKTLCPYIGEDSDGDGVFDDVDNCLDTPNGPDLGTCVKTVSGMVVSYRIGDPKQFITCTGDADCEATDGTCQLEQGDCNGNDCGDVCECYADYNDDEKVTGLDLNVLKQEYGRFDCDDPDPCYADGNEDGKVTGADLMLFKNEYGRFDCPACS